MKLVINRNADDHEYTARGGAGINGNLQLCIRGILKQTTETESSNFNGAVGFAQLIRINEVDVMSVLTVSKTRKISLWLLMKMRTSS